MRQINDILNNLSTSIHSEYHTAELLLYALIDHLNDAFNEKDFFLIQTILERLKVMVEDEDIDDLKEFLKGKIYTVIEISEKRMVPFDVEVKYNELQTQEKRLLEFIYRNVTTTPKNICGILELKKQHVSNILSDLRLKNLIVVRATGRNRWYSVTALGKLIVEEHLQKNRVSVNKGLVVSLSKQYANTLNSSVMIDDFMNKDYSKVRTNSKESERMKLNLDIFNRMV